MKARALMDGASYGPEILKTIGQAFDEAWEAIEGDVGTDPQKIEIVRSRLAKVLLYLAAEHGSDAEKLKQEALQALAAAPALN